MLIDSHCHLDFPELAADRAGVLERAAGNGVAGMVTISTRVRRFTELTAIAEAHPNIWCSVGTHPMHAHEEPDVTTAELVQLSEHPRCVAIGEAGLDYHYEGDYDAQRTGFRRHIAAARETGLPLVIHARSADDDIAAILEDESGQGAFPFVLHCFSSGAELARRGLALGGYVSFSGILTFKTAETIRAVAADAPADRILVETDAPYLAPVPHRGQSNEPGFVRHTAERLAEVRGVSFEMLAEQTTANFFRAVFQGETPMTEATEIIATIMGCGSSGGVPRIGGNWGICNPDDPRNRRRRCSLLIEGRTGNSQPTRIVIDTGCDLREQLLDAQVDRVEAVLYTHAHADHTHGIDDLRVLALNNRQRVDVYFSAEAGETITRSFSYCFTSAPGSGYPPILNQHTIRAGEPLTVGGPGGDITVMPFLQRHGEIESLGYRIGGFAYSCDLNGIPEQSAAAVSGLDLWILDALRPAPHPSHLSLSEALGLVDEYQPRAAVLTNLHIDLDYADTDRITPEHVRPAYDGLKIDVLTGTVISPK